VPEATTVVIVGGGPGGVMLGYLLARGGVRVTLLESRGDFDRRFRGDSLAPPVLDHLDQLGLARPLLAEIPHVKADAFVWSTPRRRYVLADYHAARPRFPFYALVPQARFLPWMVERASPANTSACTGSTCGWGHGSRPATRRHGPRRRHRLRPDRGAAPAAG
jgi:2-polyprenyl-6-methoxyphenol hydroxylase-like FAD-dependent oxidoreductase